MPEAAFGIPKVNWPAYSLARKFQMMHDGPGPAAVEPAAHALGKLAPEFASSGGVIQNALRGTGAAWQGRAAGAFADHMRQVASWAEQASQTGKAGGDQIANYANSYASARNKIPAPIEVGHNSMLGKIADAAGRELNDIFGSTFGVQSDYTKRLAAARAADQVANQALAEHEDRTRQAVGAFPELGNHRAEPVGGGPGAAGTGTQGAPGRGPSGATSAVGGRSNAGGGGPAGVSGAGGAGGAVPAGGGLGPAATGRAPGVPSTTPAGWTPMRTPPSDGPLPGVGAAEPPGAAGWAPQAGGLSSAIPSWRADLDGGGLSAGARAHAAGPPPGLGELTPGRPSGTSGAPAPWPARPAAAAPPREGFSGVGLPPMSGVPGLGVGGREHRSTVYLPSDEPFRVDHGDDVIKPVLGDR